MQKLKEDDNHFRLVLDQMKCISQKFSFTDRGSRSDSAVVRSSPGPLNEGILHSDQ